MIALRCGRGLPHVEHRVADLLREVELGAGEALRRILERPLGVGLRARRSRARSSRAVDGDLLDARAVEAEHDAALRGRRRVVQMHDRAPGALQRLERALDQRRARLRQHLHVDVVGDQVLARSACARSRSRSATPPESRSRFPCSPSSPAAGTCAACARRPSARSAPGCRRAGRRCTTRAGCVMTRDGHVRSGKRDRGKRSVLGGRIDLHRYVPRAATDGRDGHGLRPPVLPEDAAAHARIEGWGLCARGAQQQQAAEDERERGLKTGPGAGNGANGAAHGYDTNRIRAALQGASRSA